MRQPLAAAILFVAGIASAQQAPPVAPAEPVTETVYGRTVTDPYRWMESGKDPRWLSWLQAQGAHAEAVLARLPGRAALLADISRVTGEVAAIRSTWRAGPWLFHEQRPLGAQDMRLMVRGRDGRDRVLFAPGAGAGAQVLDWWVPSPDGRHVAVGLSVRGSEASTGHVIETATGRMLPDRVPGAGFGILSWLPDGDGFTYLKFVGQPGTPTYYLNNEARLHRLGANPATDPLLFRRGAPGVEASPTQFAAVVLEPTSSTALLAVFDGRPDRALYAAPAADVLAGRARWRKVADFADQVRQVALRGDELFLLSTRDAPRGKVLRVSAADPDLARAETVVPTGDVIIEDIEATRSALLIQTLDGGVSGLKRWQGGRLSDVALPFAGSIGALNADARSDEATLRLTGWFQPAAAYALTADGRLGDLKLAPAPAINVSPYVARRGTAVARDGTRVPYTLLSRRRGPAGPRPTLLEAYGAYGISITPAFRANVLPFLDRGGVYAVAHVRGGGEFGREWHEAGRAATKANTWRDAIDVAEALVTAGVAGPRQLVLLGTSAGGVMVGNAVNDRPDLFAGAIANVGFLNPTRYVSEQNFADIEEWGGPIRDAASYDVMAAMDPTLRIRDGARYPAVLVVSGLNDPRAATFHSAKYAARLRAASASADPVLLRVDFDAGHGFNSGRTQQDRTWADIYGFALWRAGAPGFQPGR